MFSPKILLEALLGLVILLVAFVCSAHAEDLVSSDSQVWRRIDIAVDVTQDYAVDAKTGSFRPRDAIESEVRTVLAVANEYFRPLHLLLTLTRIEYPGLDGAEDPYAAGISRKSSEDMLQPATKDAAKLH